MNNYDVFYLENFIERYVASNNKSLIYMRSTGWNKCSDVDAINASYELYKDLLPTDLWTALKNSEFVFIEVHDLVEAEEFLTSNFPEDQASCTRPEDYIHFTLFNAAGQTILAN